MEISFIKRIFKEAHFEDGFFTKIVNGWVLIATLVNSTAEYLKGIF